MTKISEPWHLYLTLGVLVVGGSVSMSYIGHGVFLPNWFVKNRGLAVGIAFSGVGVGSIILFPWLQSMIDHTGWREACQALALLLVVVLIPLNLLLQRRSPEDIGLSPDGESSDIEKKQTGASKGDPPDNIVDEQWASTEWTLSLAMKTTRFWWLSAGLFCTLFGWYGLQVHQTKFLIDIGFPSSEAAYILGLVPLFGIVGQIGIGYLSDRIGREWGWTLGCLGFAFSFVLLLVMQKSPNPTLIYLMAAAQGLLGYGIAPIFAAIPAELFQSKHYGVIFGTFSVAGSIGAAAGPWLTGVIYDYAGSYTIAFYTSIALFLFSILCIWMSSPRKVRAVAGRVAHLQAARI